METNINQCGIASHAHSSGDLAHNPGMCLTGNGPFGLQASIQSTEPHQPGLTQIFYKHN